mgnify:CR=1 FL=1
MRKKIRKAGFTLTEMVLVLAVGALLIGGVFYVYKTRIEPNRWVETKMQAFNSVIAAIENAKSAKGGVYPAGSETNLGNATDPVLRGTLGAGATDLQGWTYSCPAGVGTTMTIGIWVGDRPNNEIVQVLLNRVQASSSFTGTYTDGNLLSVTRSGVVCQ